MGESYGEKNKPKLTLGTGVRLLVSGGSAVVGAAFMGHPLFMESVNDVLTHPNGSECESLIEGGIGFIMALYGTGMFVGSVNELRTGVPMEGGSYDED